MSSANSILTRLAEVEAEKHLLQSQLSSVRKNRSPERPKRQTAFLQSSNNVKSPASTLDKVTGWLNNDKPAQRSSHSPLLDFFTQHERYHVVFDNIYQRLEIKDIVALYWLDSGLDIYVRQGAKADTLIRYIGEDKSYEFDHSYGWSDNDQHRTLTKVLIFRRTVPPGSPQIRFHLTRTLPLHSILTDCAFSTAHVNIITWNKAYCMFPNVTFIDRRMYFLHNPDEALGQILSKYSAHGWRTSEWVDYDQTKGAATSPQNTKSSRSSQTTTPATSPQKQKGDYFSLIHRRPKAPMPPPLMLSPIKLGPLMPDLLTPPPDMPLPDVPSERQPKRSPLHFPSHLPWSPFEKKSRGLPSKSGWISAASLSSSSTGPEKMIPGEMNWI
ncbi:hypothetical protein D6D03_03334 [Aureobasidium pullulans]|nr:hypothetical protein D6D03_03334 [Aureobasidium pullulans]